MKTWTDVIGQEKEKPYFKHILQQVHQERLAGKTIYPPQDEVFNCVQSLKMRNKETNRDLAEFFGNKWDGFR